MKVRTSTSLRVLVTVLAAMLLATTGSLAHAGKGPDLGGVEDNDGNPQAPVTIPGDPGNSPGGNQPIYTVPVEYYEYAYVPHCPSNGPPGQGADALCTHFSSCPQPEGHEGPARVNRWLVYRMLMNPDGTPQTGDWEFVGSQCRGADDPPEGGPEVITEADIRVAVEGVVPVPAVAVEPAGRTYVNVPTNFVSDGTDQTTAVDVMGVSVQIQFTATDTRWSFGDGSTGTGTGIRNASVGQAGAVEHAYRRSGTYSVTVSRTYSVTFSLPDGQSASMDGFSRSSPALSLPVGEVQSVVTRVN